MKKREKKMSKERPSTEGRLPSERIQAEFQRLNPEYIVHGTAMSEIIHMSMGAEAEKALQMRRGIPGMKVSKYPASWKECSLNAARKQVEHLNSAVRNLQAVFEAMNKTTMYAMMESGLPYRDIERVMAAMPTVTEKAHEFLTDWGNRRPELVSRRTGRPTQMAPDRVAMILAEEFFAATGKAPGVTKNDYLGSRDGRFIGLVHEVFSVLNIKAKVGSTAEKAANSWKARQKALEKALENTRKNAMIDTSAINDAWFKKNGMVQISKKVP